MELKQQHGIKSFFLLYLTLQMEKEDANRQMDEANGYGCNVGRSETKYVLRLISGNITRILSIVRCGG
jgi:hypothetical protein